ncbi:MAG: 4-hydroxy-3-methylbut-2-enyl diphosphate reductase [Bacilli bacterium]|nr:4-hydroxy-3-methylbut-2-enyl diphosphate reductase [Bacilli bacterium]
MEVIVINPHGFCRGVDKAIELAYKAKNENPNSQINILGTLVHNECVISDLKADGFNILHEKEHSLEEWITLLNEGDVVVFSAHGHSPKLNELAKTKKLKVYDATCPFVKANELFIKNKVLEGGQVIYIGQKGHAEAMGALGIDENAILLCEPNKPFDYESVKDDEPLLVSQTTMGLDEIEETVHLLKEKFAKAVLAAKACDATEKRQNAISNAPTDIDLYVIMGSKTSNNTIKLFNLAKEKYPNAMVIRALDVNELKDYDLSKNKKAALISGASTSLKEFDAVKDYLESI